MPDHEDRVSLFIWQMRWQILNRILDRNPSGELAEVLKEAELVEKFIFGPLGEISEDDLPRESENGPLETRKPKGTA